MLSDIETRPSTEGDARLAQLIGDMLGTVRARLDMDVAFVSEFRGGRRLFRYVDSAVDIPGLEEGGGDPADQGFCRRVVWGELPNVINDAGSLEATRNDPATISLNIGAHLSVPIVLSDGSVYGTFCCFSRAADPTLTERDAEYMRSLAEVIAREIERAGFDLTHGDRVAERIDLAVASGPSMLFQPIFDIRDHTLAGFEALSRFPWEPVRSPDQWFSEAWAIGRGLDLELAAVRAAFARVEELPSGAYLSVNLSPEAAMSPRFGALLDDKRAERVVVEITEHARVESYPPLRKALDEHRGLGARVALDDVGNGYAGLVHIVELRPEIIKLDVAITHEIETDQARQSIATAAVGYSGKFGGALVAEGIETQGELEVLRGLGVSHGQGYHLGRPGPDLHS